MELLYVVNNIKYEISQYPNEHNEHIINFEHIEVAKLTIMPMSNGRKFLMYYSLKNEETHGDHCHNDQEQDKFITDCLKKENAIYTVRQN